MYDDECDRLVLEYEAKDDVIRSVVAVREASFRKVLTEFKNAHARLSDDELAFRVDDVWGSKYATQFWKFTMQLKRSVYSLRVDFDKALFDRTDAADRLNLKMLKLFEDACLAGTLEEAALPPLKIRPR